MEARSQTVYVRLLDEGSDAARPTEAIELGGGRYVLLATPNYDPEDETWEFAPGSTVICRQEQRISGPLLLAVAQADSE